MANIELIATSTFGLEAIVKKEVKDLGFEIKQVEDGKITFLATKKDIPKANLWLRAADRVLIKLAEFKAVTFEELFQGVKAIPWEEWISEDGNFIVNGKSVKSKLYSIRDCQSITEKALVERLKKHYETDWFSKKGPDFQVQVSILKDVVTITLDTSGPGLHKRGYRTQAVAAPLKETLAAALIDISYWNPSRVLLDPFCGSGTLAIEAAMMARNIAPGLTRSFDSEKWPTLNKEYWQEARKEAYAAIDLSKDLKIYASDIDESAIEIAKENAIEAGVDDCIHFDAKGVSEIKVEDNYGVLITNPPYGIRIGEKKELIKIYKDMRRIFRNRKTWSLYVITSDERFEGTFGKKCNKKRKLYNGRLKVEYYQYFGERPSSL
ncbi:THUMP domain-containing class I SAM-dependent RNA methyltransferase [Vallitalea okinawensis]|uniref:THUMP domain-containing class I SAM-dependent RNA methyltransferase n=1 Tax=Vallitalea okinawensis TaxID=2078660 RepID=UPI000CFC646E|nr:class I SAM-dependent RNA methyltransferase [Vallitalea okinawensis]